jgi:hypothetical protein
MKNEIINDNEQNLDDLVKKARTDASLKKIIVDDENRKKIMAIRKEQLEAFGKMERNDVFDDFETDVRAAELIHDVEEIIGFNKDGMILKQFGPPEWELTDNYLLAFAYGLMGSLDKTRELYEKCLGNQISTLEQYAAAALAATQVEKATDALNQPVGKAIHWLRRIETKFYSAVPQFNLRPQHGTILFRASEKALHAYTFENMMLAIAYRYIRDEEMAEKIYKGVNAAIGNTKKFGPHDYRLFHTDTLFFHTDIPGNAMAAVYELMTQKDPDLLNTIEAVYGFLDFRNGKFINELEKMPKAIENITMAIAYLVDYLAK